MELFIDLSLKVPAILVGTEGRLDVDERIESQSND